MPRFDDTPVCIKYRCKAQWAEFWKGLPDEEPMDVRAAFARSEPVAETADWAWQLAEGVTAYAHWQIPGWVFLTTATESGVFVAEWRATARTGRMTKPAAPPPPKPKPVPPPPPPAPRMEFPPIPTDLPGPALREWLTRERLGCETALVGADKPRRMQLATRIKELDLEQRKAKASNHAALMADENDGESDEIRTRPDGSHGKLAPCVRYLLRVAKELRATVDDLQRRIDTLEDVE